MSEQIPSKQLCALVKGKVSAKQRATEAMSFISGKLKSAAKDANLNKKAFDVVFSAYKMDEADRDAFFDSISLYRDYMDENNAWADGQHAGNLVDMAQDNDPDPNADAPDPEAEAAAANAKRLKRGIKKVEPEEAGQALSELADAAAVH